MRAAMPSAQDFQEMGALTKITDNEYIINEVCSKGPPNRPDIINEVSKKCMTTGS